MGVLMIGGGGAGARNTEKKQNHHMSLDRHWNQHQRKTKTRKKTREKRRNKKKQKKKKKKKTICLSRLKVFKFQEGDKKNAKQSNPVVKWKKKRVPR